MLWCLHHLNWNFTTICWRVKLNLVNCGSKWVGEPALECLNWKYNKTIPFTNTFWQALKALWSYTGTHVSYRWNTSVYLQKRLGSLWDVVTEHLSHTCTELVDRTTIEQVYHTEGEVLLCFWCCSTLSPNLTQNLQMAGLPLSCVKWRKPRLKNIGFMKSAWLPIP